MKFLKKYSYEIFLIMIAAAGLIVLSLFTKQYFWKEQPYNSYILQAQSWLSGRLDLGKDYPYLELAIYGGKYYVSFPPFPSYLMLPFVAAGYLACDGLIELVFSVAGVVYAYKIMRHFNVSEKLSVFFALFVTFGSNWLMTSQNAWVWFIAQNMAFTLSLMAIYYALKNKAGLSLLFWACAVGCRPFQAIYIPLLLYLIYKAHKAENPDDKITDIIKKRWLAAIPCFAVALSYMILNYARFGNIAEFGHNYLPEFMRVKTGQFNISYMKENFMNLFRLPTFNKGHLDYPQADGFCFLLVSPIFISYIVYTIHLLVKREKPDKIALITIAVTAVVQLLFITAHKTMGGSHFGNRYTNDVLPLIFTAIAIMYKKGKPVIFNYPLFLFGLVFNIYGTVAYFASL